MSLSTIEVLLTESVEIKFFPSDDEFEDHYSIADQAEAIFKLCKIGVNRDKELTLVAMNDDTVVGALYASSSVEDYDGQEYVEYSFDVAVRPEFQRTGVGTLLTKACLRDAASRGDGDLPVLVKVWVVNPNMEKVLGSLGFSDGDEQRHSGGSCHMEKWI
jgi:GNAT superfamily N-acetyltransferase